MLSFMPEIRFLGIIIDAIGIDVFFMLFIGHAAIFYNLIYKGKIKPMLFFVNKKLESFDPLYFIPTAAQIRQCPQLLLHAVPFLLSTLFLLLAQVSMFS